jgi:hypothetical protein
MLLLQQYRCTQHLLHAAAGVCPRIQDQHHHDMLSSCGCGCVVPAMHVAVICVHSSVQHTSCAVQIVEPCFLVGCCTMLATQLQPCLAKMCASCLHPTHPPPSMTATTKPAEQAAASQACYSASLCRSLWHRVACCMLQNSCVLPQRMCFTQ